MHATTSSVNLLHRLPDEVIFQVAGDLPTVIDRERLFEAYYQGAWPARTYERKWLDQTFNDAVAAAHARLPDPSALVSKGLAGRRLPLHAMGFRHHLQAAFVHRAPGQVGRDEALTQAFDACIRTYLTLPLHPLLFCSPLTMCFALLYRQSVETSVSALQMGAKLAGRLAGASSAWAELHPYISASEKVRRAATVGINAAALVGCGVAAAALAGAAFMTVGLAIGITAVSAYLCASILTGAPIYMSIQFSLSTLSLLLAVGAAVTSLVYARYRHSFPLGAVLAAAGMRYADHAHREVESLSLTARQRLSTTES